MLFELFFISWAFFSYGGRNVFYPPPLPPLPVQPDNLNYETPMFCLLAVFLYMAVAQEECLDCQPLSHWTLLHSGDGDGFWMEFFVVLLFLFLFFTANVTLIGSEDWCSGILFFPSSFLCFQHFHFVCHAKVSFNKKAPILGRKRDTAWLQVHRWTWGKWKVIETTQVHRCAGGEMRLKLDFTGAGRQIVWIIKEGERTEVGSSDPKLMQRNESTVF